jgi:solute carrier family 35 protein C2
VSRTISLAVLYLTVCRLLKRSSVVTLSICGIFKEVMTISAAAIIFKDPLTPVNISGLLVTIVSIAAYNYIKISKMREEAVQETHLAHHHASGTTRADTGYAAVTGDFEDLENESVHTRNRDGVSNANFTSLENDIGGNHDNDIRVGESAISPLI